MGAFGAPTEKPTTFWSNHRDWLLMLVREMTKEDRQRIEELAVRLTIRKFAACLQCQVAYMLVPYVIHGSSRHTHTHTCACNVVGRGGRGCISPPLHVDLRAYTPEFGLALVKAWKAGCAPRTEHVNWLLFSCMK